MYRPGFDHLLNKMPIIDASKTEAEQKEEIAETVAVMEEFHSLVMEKSVP